MDKKKRKILGISIISILLIVVIFLIVFYNGTDPIIEDIDGFEVSSMDYRIRIGVFGDYIGEEIDVEQYGDDVIKIIAKYEKVRIPNRVYGSLDSDSKYEISCFNSKTGEMIHILIGEINHYVYESAPKMYAIVDYEKMIEEIDALLNVE